jgi:pilus assembly protein CpaE
VAKIYVIDDDEGLLRMVGMMLERGGHEVTTIANPVEGLDKIKSSPPDLLVLDVMMPTMSGHDVTRQIRAIEGLADLPIIILTARSQEIDRKTAMSIGASAYMSKPISSRELTDQVNTLLAKIPDQAVLKKSSIVAVYGLRGGVGQTTLATNLAAALRRITQHDVCLIDMSPSGGQAARHLRLKPTHHWGEALTMNKLDWNSLRGLLTRHSSGLMLLAAPSAPQLPTVPSAKLMKNILSLLQEEKIFVVIDLPGVYNPAFTASLSMADIALHVVTPDPISVETAVHIDNILAKSVTSPKQKSYLLNHVTPEAMMPVAMVERGLGSRVGFAIAYDANQSRALAQGVPLALTTVKSSVSTAVSQMASVIWQHATK